MKTKTLGLLAVGLLAGPMAALSAPLNAVESEDFSDSAWGSNIGVLDVGKNSIAGVVTGGGGRDNAPEQDFFQMELLAGFRIVGVEIEISGFETPCCGQTGFGRSTNEFLSRAPDGTPGPGGSFSFSGNDLFLVNGLNFDAPGLYGAGLSNAWWYTSEVCMTPPGSFERCTPVAPFGTSFSYRVTYTVEAAAVPEPGTLALLGLGLAGLGLSRRRKAN